MLVSMYDRTEYETLIYYFIAVIMQIIRKHTIKHYYKTVMFILGTIIVPAILAAWNGGHGINFLLCELQRFGTR